MFDSNLNTFESFTNLGIGALGSELTNLLMAEPIVPGYPPSYQVCKTIYSYHPLGSILADASIKRAQAQNRIISVAKLGEERIVKQFEECWKRFAKVGATRLIRNLMNISRIYGVGSIGIGERGKDSMTPLELDGIDERKVFFNLLDPLNTAGSLVLNQDPNDPEFLKQGVLSVNGKPWHPSRTIAQLHEDPLYIEWSNSAFGFVGRSIYQRALYSLKTYLQIMVTTLWVSQKAGLLVANLKSPSSIIDNMMQTMGAWKRTQIQAGVTGNVLQVGIDEELSSLNLEHLEPALRLAKELCIKDIASATGMPASIIAQETLTEGFGEGTEDAKKEAAFLNEQREMMQPVYQYMDRIVQRLAWTPEFFETMKADYKEYRDVTYETALHEWIRAFEATWPNILLEPESEKAKTADVQFKAAVAFVETIGAQLDPENRARLFVWLAEQANAREELFASQLDLDPEMMREYFEERANELETAAAEEGAKSPPTFSQRA
jgi:hypothetical protein